ncbi:MAG: pyridoxal phosphate-dependent aminotransferase, partial [Bacteroidales bacterium]|nr:pyridoxal phosphate-dependent aminotransferase [Bacteroidales bacterium]
MPQISKKGKSMPESPIRKLVPFAEEAKRMGRKVYHLNIGQPDIPTPEVALAAIKNIDLKVIEYSHSAGIPSYRKKLIEFYKRKNINIKDDEILVTTGGSEGLVFTFMSCMDNDDEVIIPEPFYANYNGFTTEAGVKVKPITSTIENDFALPPIEEFEKIITPKTKGILISNPNNPTGYLYSKKELLDLAKIIKKYDLYLISDEVYRDFAYSDEPYFSALELAGLEENVIMIDSVSKRFSSCGMRIGTLISRNKKVISTILKFSQARLSPPTFGQIASEASIDAPQEYYDNIYTEFYKRRNFTVERLNKIKGVVCPNPNGAFYTIIRIPVDDADRFCQWLLSDFEYNNQTVMFAPGSGFYSTIGLGK